MRGPDIVAEIQPRAGGWWGMMRLSRLKQGYRPAPGQSNAMPASGHPLVIPQLAALETRAGPFGNDVDMADLRASPSR